MAIGDRDFQSIWSPNRERRRNRLSLSAYLKNCWRKIRKKKRLQRGFTQRRTKRKSVEKSATEEGYETFVVPDDVGGRFCSYCSRFAADRGKRSGYRQINGRSGIGKKGGFGSWFWKNGAMQYVAVRNILLRKGKTVEVLANYEPSLHLCIRMVETALRREWRQGSERNLSCICRSYDRSSFYGTVYSGWKQNSFETVLNVEKSRAEIGDQRRTGRSWRIELSCRKNVDFINKCDERNDPCAYGR